MSTDSDYHIGNRWFRVVFSSLVDVPADALISSDDNYLTMGGGVSAALLSAGGAHIMTDARKHIPLSLGDVAVTTAGSLAAKFVFHGVTINHDNYERPDGDCLRRIVRRCLALGEALRLRHIAFPALGTGAGGFPFELAADAMTREIADFLAREATHIGDVTLALYSGYAGRPSQLDLFYERAVGIAAQWTDSRHLLDLVDQLQGILARTTAPRLQEKVRVLRSEIVRAEASLATHGDQPALPASPLAPASIEAVEVAAKSAEVLDWEDVTARETVLKLRLQSLRTQHNILIGSRNLLEERQAMFGPLAVPTAVLNEIVGVTAQIDAKDEEIRAVKAELAQLRTVRAEPS